MSTAGKVDRDAVEKFFKWKNPKRALYTLGTVAILLGLIMLPSPAVPLGLVFVVGGGFLFFKGSRSGNKFLRYYDAVKAAKAFDFDAVRRRSFNKTERSLDSLLDFDAQDLLSLGAEFGDQSGTEGLSALGRKSVFLWGREAAAGAAGGSRYLRFVRVGDAIVAEYSPIWVSILYLTRSEMIVYVANIDITRGDLLLEETSRVFLKDIVEIKTQSTSRRLKRFENLSLFRSYEKETKVKLEDEIVNREHAIRVTKTDGRHLDLPVGAPEYETGKQGILDSGRDDEGRFTRVAREIFKRINDAKASVQDAPVS
jgi:hypothetical protein